MSQILGQKASVKFTDDDEFVKLEKRKFENLNVQLESNMDFEQFPEARPIGEILAQINGEWLGGSDDADDMAMTLASIRSSEIQHSRTVEMPQMSNEIYRQTGNKIENVLAQERRISPEELAAAEADDDDEKFKKSEFRKQKEQHDRQL